MPIILDWIHMSSESFAEMQYKVARTMNGDGVNSFGGLIVGKKILVYCQGSDLTVFFPSAFFLTSVLQYEISHKWFCLRKTST